MLFADLNSDCCVRTVAFLCDRDARSASGCCKKLAWALLACMQKRRLEHVCDVMLLRLHYYCCQGRSIFRIWHQMYQPLMQEAWGELVQELKTMRPASHYIENGVYEFSTGAEGNVISYKFVCDDWIVRGDNDP